MCTNCNVSASAPGCGGLCENCKLEELISSNAPRKINWMVGFEYDDGSVTPIDVKACTAFDAVEIACARAEDELESGWTVGAVLDCGWAVA